MRTDQLISALAADPAPAYRRLQAVWWLALGAAALLAAAVFFMTLGPRPDFGEVLGEPRFLFKFLPPLALVCLAFILVGRLGTPGTRVRPMLWALAIPPLLLAAAVGTEMALVPPLEWRARWVGTNLVACLTFIPLIGLLPLVCFVLSLRYAAPTDPPLAGAAAGLLAGALAALFYAMHCPDDSPLFVASWYPLGVLTLAALGAFAARRWARW